MSNENDESAISEKAKDFADEIKDKAEKAKEDLKSVPENALESRIEDMQKDPEFQLRAKRLEKRIAEPKHDDISNNATHASNETTR